MHDFNISVGSQGVRREIGEVISLDKTGVLFQYKKPRSSKRVQIHVPASRLILAKDNGQKGEIIFHSGVYDVAEFANVTGVKESALPGINVGTTKQGEKLYFSPHAANVTSLVSREKKVKTKADKKLKKAKPDKEAKLAKKSKPGKEGKVKKTKGKKISKKNW